MKINKDCILYAVSFASIATCLYYAKKEHDKKEQLNEALQSIDDKIVVNFDNDELKIYVNAYVEDEVHKRADAAMRASLAMHRGAIRDDVAKAVLACKEDISKGVEDEIKKQVGSLNIDDIKREALTEAKNEAIRALNTSFDDILKNYKENLERLSVMYSAVAERTRKQNIESCISDLGSGIEFNFGL